ncbi:MAG: hypothetical protein JSW68_08155, partial [Burkholderiales bacterium]
MSAPTDAEIVPSSESEDSERVETLPFTVRPARSPADLEKAIQCRAEAYGHHVSDFFASLSEPEDYDFSPGSMVLLAEWKSDRRPVGSMRVVTNVKGHLELEDYVELPTSLRGKALAEAGRLSVLRGFKSALVKLALWKAFFRLCLAEQIDTMVVSAKPPGDRDYIMLVFREVQPGGLWFRHRSL